MLRLGLSYTRLHFFLAVTKDQKRTLVGRVKSPLHTCSSTLLEVVQQAAQSFHEQNIIAFIQLLNYQRSLFSQQDLAELNQLVAPLPDDLEELSKAIATWCNQEEHSAHLNALCQVRQTLSNSALEQVSGTHSDTKTPDYPLNKQTLSHAIEQSSSAN